MCDRCKMRTVSSLLSLCFSHLQDTGCQHVRWADLVLYHHRKKDLPSGQSLVALKGELLQKYISNVPHKSYFELSFPVGKENWLIAST